MARWVMSNDPAWMTQLGWDKSILVMHKADKKPSYSAQENINNLAICNGGVYALDLNPFWSMELGTACGNLSNSQL